MKIKQYIIVVMLIIMTSICVWAGDVCSQSYVMTDKGPQFKLRAGIMTQGDIQVNHVNGWWYTDPDGNKYPYPGQTDDSSWAFNDNSAYWGTTGRWFVTMAYDRSFLVGHSTGTVVDPWLNLKKGDFDKINGTNLSMMFGTSWVIDPYIGLCDKFVGSCGTDENTGFTPAGKFCTFKVRITDPGGLNERYYYVGDEETGSFVYEKEWIEDNFVNNPKEAKYGEYCDAIWQINNENIQVRITVNTIYDQARFNIQVKNTGKATKYVSVAMCGTPATANAITEAWDKRPYFSWNLVTDDNGMWKYNYCGASDYVSKIDKYGRTHIGDDTQTDMCETNVSYFYLPGIGIIDKGMIFSKASLPDRLEMYNYRYVNADPEIYVGGTYTETIGEGESAVTYTYGYKVYPNSRTEYPADSKEKVDQTYYKFPPKSSDLDIMFDGNNYNYDPGFHNGAWLKNNKSALFNVAQALFDNNLDATVPDYLIIDKSSNMLNIRKVYGEGTYPFGYWTQSPINRTLDDYMPIDDGNFPVWNVADKTKDHIWPGKESGVKNPYENTLLTSRAFPYEDQFKDPLSYMVIWGSEALSPGKVRDIVTYYGQGGKDISDGRKLGSTFERYYHSLLLESPSTLDYKVTSDEYGEDTLEPDTFTVKPIIVNSAIAKSYFDFNLEKIQITLPKGLEFDKSNFHFEPITSDTYETVLDNVTLGKLDVFDKMIITLKATGEYSGSLTYKVNALGSYESGGNWEQSCSRSILVPTTKKGKIYGGEGNLLAAPFKNVLVNGEEGVNPFTVSDVYGLDTVGYVWDSANQKYVKFSDIDITRDNPMGYWVLKSKDEDVQNEYDYTFPSFLKPKDINYGDTDKDTNYYMSEETVTLHKGWNIVSNPYIYPMQWLKTVVKDIKTNDIKLLEEAVDASWLSKSLYSWEPHKDNSQELEEGKGKYLGHNTLSVQLLPNRGYWVYAYRDLYLYYTPMIYPNARIYDDEYYTDPDKYFIMGPATEEN